MDNVFESCNNQAQIDAARHSLEAMSNVLQCKRIIEAHKIAEVEVAELIEFISDLEEEKANEDIVITFRNPVVS